MHVPLYYTIHYIIHYMYSKRINLLLNFIKHFTNIKNITLLLMKNYVTKYNLFATILVIINFNFFKFFTKVFIVVWHFDHERNTFLSRSQKHFC